MMATANHYLSGCDYLMLGFDHELRSKGYAGNSCQIILELGSPISAEALRGRLEFLCPQYPLLNARPAGLLWPRWKLPRGNVQTPQVRVHRVDTEVYQRLINEPLTWTKGELARFDLFEGGLGRMSLMFTWSHALMDAPSAEYFLALVGREDFPLPAASAPLPRASKFGLARRCKLAWRNVKQFDQFCLAPPRSLGARRPSQPASLHFRVESFSTQETARVRANAVRHCGLLRDAQYHGAVSVLELHHLHQRLGCPSPSYVLPIPVALRPKGNFEPLFSNQVAMLMLQFLPEQLDSIGAAVASLKQQTEQAMRAGMVESGILLQELLRILPLPIYMGFVKRALKGEICSLYYGNTAAVSPLLTSFLGARIVEFTHVAAVTPSPGIGVIFYYFGGQLRVTVAHLAEVLSEEEAAQFAAGLRKRLLEP